MNQEKLKQLINDRLLIKACGGSASLANQLGYSVQRINNWNKRGIPALEKLKHRALLLNE